MGKRGGVTVNTALGPMRAGRAVQFLVEADPQECRQDVLVGILRGLRERAAERAVEVAQYILSKDGYPPKVRNVASDIVSKGA